MAAEGGYVKTGWLFKKSDSIFSTWGKRWICVKSRQLLCFRNDKDVTPKYTMSLERGKVLEEGVTKKKNFCFSVLNLDEVWVFSADDEESRVAWMKAIKSCIPSNTMKKSQSCSDVLAEAGIAPAITPRSHPNLAASTGHTNSSPALPTGEKKPGPSDAPPNDSNHSKLKKSGSGKEENKENAGKDGTKDNTDKEKDNNKDKDKDKEKEKENKEKENHDKRPEPTKVIVRNLQELCQDKDGKYFVDRSGLSVESIETHFGLLLSIINFIQRQKKFVDPNAKPSEHHRGRPKPDEAALAKLEEEIISPTPPEIKKLFKHPEQVGEGGFGLVVRADVSGDKGKPKLPSTVAIKKMSHVSLKERANNCREIGFLQRLDHPNIVKYYRTYRGYNLKESKPNPDEIWVIMEYLEGGTLSQARSSHKFHEDNIAYIARELLTGIAYLHSLNLAHRDLKSANVMLSVEGGVKMIDFGLCADLSSGRRDDVCGSPFWMPPEMIKNESHGLEVDIWSFAICLLELANGAPPHEHSATKAMFIAATDGYPQPFDNSDKWSSDMKNFFAKCLVIDPEKRAKAKELLKDPWLNRASTKKTMKNILTDIFIRDTLQSVGFGGF